MVKQVGSRGDLIEIQGEVNEDILITDDIDMKNEHLPLDRRAIRIKDCTLDGQGHTIKNYSIRYPVDILAIHSNGAIKNLNFKNLEVDLDSRHNNVGGLLCKNKGIILNCSVEGTLSRNSYKVGGITASNGGKIVNCEFRGEIDSDQGEAGGIVGQNWGEGKVISCSSSGKIYGGREVGGIASYNEGHILNCDSDSTVGLYGINENCCGGLVGKNEGQVVSSYFNGGLDVISKRGNSKVGALIGENLDTVRNCYSVRANFEENLIGDNSSNIENIGFKTNVKEITRNIIANSI